MEFDGVGREQYDAVNAALGIDQSTGEGDWPDGMLSHAGGTKPGNLVVFEVWDSQESQGQFMDRRLDSALGKAGSPARRRGLE